MKKITLVLFIAITVVLQSAMPVKNIGQVNKGTIQKRTLISVYCPTGNPTSDYIGVHLTNGTNTYNFSVPPGAPANYVLGQIESTCGYTVTLSSSGSAHTMQFYYFYASNTTYAAYQYSDMCLTCGSCPTLRIS